MDDYEKLYFTVWHARAAMLRYSARETCILATRIIGHITRDLLGVTTLPIAVGVTGLNPIAFAKIQAGEDFAGVDGAVGLHCLHRGDLGDRPGEWWGGHLMCIIDGKYLVDPSADQFSVPESDIVVPGPLVVEAGDDARRAELAEFSEGDRHLSFELPGGGLIDYDPHPEDLSYMDSMDWEDTVPGDKLYDHAFQTVEGLLDLYGDGPMPELPDLPWALTKRTASREEAQARDMQAVVELGYTPEEVRVKMEREEQRERARATARITKGMERGAQAHAAIARAAQDAAAAGSTLGALLAGHDPSNPSQPAAPNQKASSPPSSP